MIDEKEARELVDQGYMKIWMGFEALAIKEDVARGALEDLIDKIDTDERVKMYKKQLGEAKEVKNPMKNIEKGTSVVAEIELVVMGLEDLANVTMEYGPSSIEIMEPAELKIEAFELQALLNSMSGMMHKFAAMGIGGIPVISIPKKG